jgi:hypothetical protein
LQHKTGKIVIFGAYKTGTTGLFYKIKNSLPPNVRPLFEENRYVFREGDDRRWVLAKTMLAFQEGSGPVDYTSFMGFDKKIYLVRDPRDWIISATLFIVQQEPSLYSNDDRLRSILELLRKKQTLPGSFPLWKIMEQILEASDNHSFAEMLAAIERHYRWLPEFEKRLRDYCLVRYEDFVERRLKKLQDYLGFPLAAEAEVAQAHEHVIRTKTYGNWKNWFLPEDIQFFKPLFDEYMRCYGYSDDWILNARQTISPESCSKYVERTVKRKRGTALGFLSSRE